MEYVNFLLPFQTFLLMSQSVTVQVPVVDLPDFSDVALQRLQIGTIPLNEGYPMAACSIILSHVVYQLNHQDTNESNYKFGIYLIVKKEKTSE